MLTGWFRLVDGMLWCDAVDASVYDLTCAVGVMNLRAEGMDKWLIVSRLEIWRVHRQVRVSRGLFRFGARKEPSFVFRNVWRTEASVKRRTQEISTWVFSLHYALRAVRLLIYA